MTPEEDVDFGGRDQVPQRMVSTASHVADIPFRLYIANCRKC